MSGYAKQRARDTIARLAGQGLDLVTFWQEVSEAVAKAVPHYMTPCWFTLDPASLLVTSHYQTEFIELPPEWLAHEYYQDDFHKLADVARSERGISTIYEATGGDPSRSRGWNLYVRPYGGTRNCSSPFARGRVTPGGCLVSTESRVDPNSIPTNSASCARCRRTLLRARGEGCSSGRLPILMGRRLPGWSSSGRTGASSRLLPA